MTSQNAVFLNIYGSHQPEKGVNIGAGKIKAILLKKNGWIGEWNCKKWVSQTLTDLVFEDHGKKIIFHLQYKVMENSFI